MSDPLLTVGVIIAAFLLTLLVQLERPPTGEVEEQEPMPDATVYIYEDAGGVTASLGPVSAFGDSRSEALYRLANATERYEYGDKHE